MEAEAPGYFAAVSEYIHLNPARARMLEDTDLRSYRWSSYPRFVEESTLPGWLKRGRAFSALDLMDEGAGARKRYAGWMQARTRDVLELGATSEEVEAWRQLRRGWYVGGESFRDQLMEWAKGVVAGRKRSSYGEGGLRGHDEQEAERCLSLGLQNLGLELEEVAALRQSDRRQQMLAWLLKSRTVVTDDWILQRLRWAIAAM